MSKEFSEDSLVEQPAFSLFSELGWETANCFDETRRPAGSLGRETCSEVVLLARLRPALEASTPTCPRPCNWLSMNCYATAAS